MGRTSSAARSTSPAVERLGKSLPGRHAPREPLDLLAEPRRREILRLVWRRERTAGEIAAQVPVTFGAVSQHLRLLREAGIVEVRREGRFRIYRARTEGLGPLAAALEAMWAEGLARLRDLAEEEEEKGHGRPIRKR